MTALSFTCLRTPIETMRRLWAKCAAARKRSCVFDAGMQHRDIVPGMTCRETADQRIQRGLAGAIQFCPAIVIGADAAHVGRQPPTLLKCNAFSSADCVRAVAVTCQPRCQIFAPVQAPDHVNRQLLVHASRSSVPFYATARVRTSMGGPAAPLDIETSVRGMADVIAVRWGSGQQVFVDYRNEIIPW